MSDKKIKLLDQVRMAIRVRHYSVRTEKSYVYWIRFYIRYHRLRHPAEMGKPRIEAFLSFLASDRKVSASTQNQALSALLFLYKKVLDVDPGDIDALVRAKRRENVPTVLTPEEATLVLSRMTGTAWLMASLLYGSGLRLTEVIRLRVKDLDFSYRQLFVRNGKGGKDRTVPMPEGMMEPLQAQLAKARVVYESDLASEWTGASMPVALARKYPRAAYEWAWQYVFSGVETGALPLRRHAETAPPSSHGASEIRAPCRQKLRHCQTGELSYIPAFLCNSPSGFRIRHPYRAGTVGAPGRGDDDDLHACPGTRWARGS